MSAIELYKVGDTLECLVAFHRNDGKSAIIPGDRVIVTHAFAFGYKGEPCQDLTVRKDYDMPIAVLNGTGRFRKVTP